MKEEILSTYEKEIDRIKRTPIMPIYTCGGHGYEDDDDEDFWCPVCFEHIGTHYGFAEVCPICKQAIEPRWNYCYSYDEMKCKSKTYEPPRRKNLLTEESCILNPHSITNVETIKAMRVECSRCGSFSLVPFYSKDVEKVAETQFCPNCGVAVKR